MNGGAAWRLQRCLFSIAYAAMNGRMVDTPREYAFSIAYAAMNEWPNR